MQELKEPDLQFDPETSFKDEITTREEAEQAVDYFSKNLHDFQSNLANTGMRYDDVQDVIKRTWMNLLKSCKRVGYIDDPVVTETAKLYKFKL